MPNTIYDIDFDQFAVQQLPPDKRFKRQVAWVRILLSVLQYLRDIWFGSYRTGSTAPTWVNSAPYAKYDLVKYSNKIIYESLIDNNSEVPTNTSAWRVAQLNFIGLSERILYNGQKIVLEWAMNKWFGTTFRQPTYMGNYCELRWQLQESDTPFMDGNIQIKVNGGIVVDVGSPSTGSLFIATGATVEVIAPTFIAWSGVTDPYIQLAVFDQSGELFNDTKGDQTEPFLTYTFTAAAFGLYQAHVRTNQEGVVPSSTGFDPLNVPAFPLPGHSDIYIGNNAIPIPAFRSGLTEDVSTYVGLNSSSEFVGNEADFTVLANFSIYCPQAVYDALDPTLINNDKIFRAFVDKYVPAGVTYTVTPY